MYISDEEAKTINERNLKIVGSWGVDSEELMELFEKAHTDLELSQADYDKKRTDFEKRMNSTEMFVICSVLYSYKDVDVSFNKLEGIIDNVSEKLVVRTTLRNYLGVLQTSGLISGFEERSSGSTNARKIRFTESGVEYHKRFLSLCRDGKT